jgi:hypothetical protein
MKTVRVPPVFTVTEAPIDGIVGKTIFAWTKGEARAKLRDNLALEKLPPGVVLSKSQDASEATL